MHNPTANREAPAPIVVTFQEVSATPPADSQPMPKTGYLFRRLRGGPYSPNWLSACVSRYLKEMGINATAHSMRHWFASEVYANCHDIRVTQELLGHSDPSTTAGYIAYSHVDAAAAVGSLRIGA